MAQQYSRLGVYDAAFDQYSDAIWRSTPKSVAAWDGRARVWRDWGMTGLALSDVHRADTSTARRPAVLGTRSGRSSKQAGQCGEARDAYAVALKLIPTRHGRGRI